MQQKHALNSLMLAVALAIALTFVPYADKLTYPLRLLVTFIHEGCHALAGVLTGGFVNRIAIMPDGSGVTETRGGINVLIASAGYVGATFYGTLLLSLLRRGIAPKILLLATAGIIGVLTLFFVRPFPDVFSFFWGAALVVILGALALFLPPHGASWAAAFVGVQCVLNAFFDLRTLLQISTIVGTHSDAHNMQAMTWVPAPVWALLWMGLAAYLLWVVLVRPTLHASGAFGVGETGGARKRAKAANV